MNPSLSDLSVPDLSEYVMAAAEAVAGSEAEGLRGMWKGRQPDPAGDGPPLCGDSFLSRTGKNLGSVHRPFCPQESSSLREEYTKRGQLKGQGRRICWRTFSVILNQIIKKQGLFKSNCIQQGMCCQVAW